MMAMRKSYLFLGGKERVSPMPSNPSSLQFEFDESDIWNNTISSDEFFPQKSIPNSRFLKKSAKKGGGRSIPAAATSLPVNIPDWSKILGNDYKNNCLRERNDNDDDDDDVDGRIPPHELLARTRVASFSVHEGMGRTLKGRDLSRVRNAIWKQTGFED